MAYTVTVTENPTTVTVSADTVVIPSTNNVDNSFAIVDETDPTKKLMFSVGSEATGATLTITIPALAASRILNLPLITGTDTIPAIGLAQTWTATQTFAAIAAASATLTAALPVTSGGLGFNTATLGDIIYASASNTLAKLAGNTTTTRYKLQQVGDGVNSAAPSWVPAVDVQVFTASGTWQKPSWATKVTVQCIGGGGGGGSGRRGADGTVRTGGAGGGGGGRITLDFDASLLLTSETVTVGAGGAGGAAQTADDNNGSAGSTGGTSTFSGSPSTGKLRATGGLGGAAGNTTTTTGGAGATVGSGAAGGTASATGLVGTTGGTPTAGSGGGASGGGITSGDATSAGGAGGGGLVGVGGTAGAADGGTAAAAPATAPAVANAAVGGGGGGGGGSSRTTAGGDGAIGGLYGGGGGGGGASKNGFNSGAGSIGAAGIVVVIST